ncbi:MAG: spondin domain-containing protein [Myxococcota bacterium]
MRFQPARQVTALVCSALAGLVVGCSDDGPATPAATTAHFKLRIENIARFTNRKAGAFEVPVGAAMRKPLAPGEAYEVKFTAGPAHRLVFASMFGQSNDWFFAPDPTGIALFDADKKPITGDITDQIKLWDAGTEVDEEPAVGAHTGPKQASSSDGPGAADPNPLVREVPLTVALTAGGSFTRPAVSDMIAVTLSADAATREFTLRIENVADDAATLMTSEGAKPVRVSPGVWALGTGGEPVFTVGVADRGEGLEQIAEMGDQSGLAVALAGHSGVATPLSPGVWVLHEGGMPFWSDGEPDRGEGLEQIAETGDISVLDASCMNAPPLGALECGSFATALGASSVGPIKPGGAYEIDLVASPGERLSWAQMYGASNDWFFGTPDDGIALFDGQTPLSGDITDRIQLWDAGTEADEELAIGVHGGPPEGPADALGVVRPVEDDVYATPVAEHVKVTLTVVPE